MTISLLKAEFIKLYNSRATRIISIIYVCFILIILSFTGVLSVLSRGANEPADNYVYGFLILFLSILPIANAILNVCNEFSSNMMKQNIINGMTRNQFILSKFLSNFILSIYYSLLFFLFALLLSKGALQYTFHYALSLFFILNIANSFAFIFKRTGVAIAAFYVYYSFGETLIYARILDVFDFEFDSILETPEILSFTTKANMLLFYPDTQLTGIFACLVIILMMLGLQSLIIRNRSL
jgi:ABC-2 type transport system permease protein